MRTCNRIVDAVRRNEPVTEEEMRFVIAAQDMILAQATAALRMYQETEVLKLYFQSTMKPVDEFVGHDNSPYNPEFVKWHKRQTLAAAAVQLAMKRNEES